jgi:NO-binding membrane sensor protein with MHYT domain
MGQITAPIAGFYDLRLVALSVLIAVSASNAGLDLGGWGTAAYHRIPLGPGWLAEPRGTVMVEIPASGDRL